MEHEIDESADVDAKPKPKFKFLKKGEGTHKRVFAPKLKQQQKFNDSFSAKVDIAEALDEYDSHQSLHNQVEKQGKARGNKTGHKPSARQPEPTENSPCGPQEVSGTSWPRCGAGGRDARKDESTEWSAGVANAFQAVRNGRSRSYLQVISSCTFGREFATSSMQDAEVQEFARLERQIRMEVGDCTPSPQVGALHHIPGMVLRMMFPAAVIANVTGDFAGCITS